ncbi:MAG: hypothetical protein GXO90_03955 [FCB group bacterium]|nr:hypothetical protein [FCB group bacterium]
MKRIALLGLILFLKGIDFVYGAFEWAQVSPHNRARGSLILTVTPSPLMSTLDPSALVRARPAAEAAIAHPYQLASLRASQFALQGYCNGWGWAGSWHQFGRRDYREQKFNLAVGRSINSYLSVGITANVYHLRIQNYGASSVLGWTLAIRDELQPGLLWGVILQNITNAQFHDTEGLPVIITTGFQMETKDLVLGMEWEQDLDYPGGLRFGVEYQPVSSIRISLGADQRPPRLAGGFSLIYRGVEIEYAVDYCPVLARFTTDLGLVVPLHRNRTGTNP